MKVKSSGFLSSFLAKSPSVRVTTMRPPLPSAIETKGELSQDEAPPPNNQLSKEEEITRVGNEWAPLFAADVPAGCNYMYGQPLCEEYFGKVGGPPEVRRPSEFQKSFVDATVERVVVRDAKRVPPGILVRTASAEFSNGELVEFIEEIDPPLSDQELYRYVRQICGCNWLIDDVGGNADKK